MSLEIDPQYLDVDFTKQPEYVFGDLGCCRYGDAAAYEDVESTIPRDQWQPLSEEIEATKTGLEWLIKRIYDQSQEGACVSNMVGQSLEICQAQQYGFENVVPLSAISHYKRTGRSPSSGSMLDDALDEAKTRGILPLDTPENRAKFGEAVMPNTGFYKPFPANWEATAKRFKAHEAHVIRSFDGLVSALLKGHPVGVGRQGHSITYVGIRFKNGRIHFPYANSWNERWGQAMGHMKGGFGVDTESQAKMSASWAIAWRTIVVN